MCKIISLRKMEGMWKGCEDTDDPQVLHFKKALIDKAQLGASNLKEFFLIPLMYL